MSELSRPYYAITEARSILGMKPTGIRKSSRTITDHGLAGHLQAQVVEFR